MKSIFINQLPGSLRIAECWDGQLQELAWLKTEPSQDLGTVYLGEVSQVLPGIQSAFIHLGDGGSGFLNRSGLPPNLIRTKMTKLADVVRQGQRFWVQIQKPALEGKQPLVSSRLRFLGFFLVFLPAEQGIYFSKKFTGPKRDISTLPVLLDGAGGWVVRSAASQVPLAWIEKEAQLMAQLVKAKLGKPEGSARLVWRPSMPEQWLMDHSFPVPDAIFVDNRSCFERLGEFLRLRHPGLFAKLRFHDPKRPIFEVYKIQSQIEKALAARIWLPSGGTIDIRQTPALVAIDVNSGKHTKSRGGVGAALRINLESVNEIAKQLRLRNLAGLVVIDFIEMRAKSEIARLETASQKAFAKDEASIDQLPLNRMGLLCITRERRGPDLNRQTHRVCPRCYGKGWVIQFESVVLDLQTKLIKDGCDWFGERVLIQAHPEFAAFLDKRKGLLFHALEKAHGFEIIIQSDVSCPIEKYNLELMEN